MTTEVLQPAIPATQRTAAARRLPGMQVVDGADWLTIDAAYTAQLSAKAVLLEERKPEVLAALPDTGEALSYLLDEVLHLLAQRDDFVVSDVNVYRPDGISVAIDRTAPLETVSQLIQEDICLLQKKGDAHVLTAALLCFPASWTLSEKLGRPLMAIHTPVPDYDEAMGARVQRLFDGVQVGRPIWRANLLRYADPSLHHPRREAEPRKKDHVDAKYERSERQTIWRLGNTDAVVFAIHTSVVRAE